MKNKKLKIKGKNKAIPKHINIPNNMCNQIDKLKKLNNISRTNLIIQCIDYALENDPCFKKKDIK